MCLLPPKAVVGLVRNLALSFCNHAALRDEGCLPKLVHLMNKAYQELDQRSVQGGPPGFVVRDTRTCTTHTQHTHNTHTYTTHTTNTRTTQHTHYNAPPPPGWCLHGGDHPRCCGCTAHLGQRPAQQSHHPFPQLHTSLYYGEPNSSTLLPTFIPPGMWVGAWYSNLGLH